MSKREAILIAEWLEAGAKPETVPSMHAIRAAMKLRALDASHQRLKEALSRLEVASNTVDYCYRKNPANFAAALAEMKDDAESARAALEQAKELS